MYLVLARLVDPDGVGLQSGANKHANTHHTSLDRFHAGS